jgi:mRNA interferase RelE/StbE
MRFEIILEKPVLKFLKVHAEIAERFFEKLEIIKHNPKDSRLDIKKLQWFDDSFRLRIGKYRFLFRIDGSTIIIYFYDADSRWDIY